MSVPNNINTAHGIFVDNYNNNNVEGNKSLSDEPQEFVYLVNSITKVISNTNPHKTLKLGKFKEDVIENFIHTTITQLTSMRYYHLF